MAKLELLVIHCTATRAGVNVQPDDVRRWHTDPPPGGRGWRQVGYADLILLDGTIANLAPYDADDVVDPWEVTNGVRGINSRSRHVCYVGGLDATGQPADTRTNDQLWSLFLYVNINLRLHPGLKVAGHNQFAPKACPSFDVPTWMRAAGYRAENIYTP
jgi:N-acetylmuramoyl-L-alanine amidase